MLPQLRELEHAFPAELVVIGIHSAKFPAEKIDANLRKAVLRNELEHPVVNDAEFRIWQEYAVRAWPTLLVIDPRGYVIGKHEGEFPLPAMRDYLSGVISAFDAERAIERRPVALTPEHEESGALRFPGKILADPARDRLFVADSGHHRVLLTGLDGTVRAGFDGGTPRFRNPQGLALDETGNRLYVADTGNHLLRRIDLESGETATVAGTGERGYGGAGGSGPEVALASPWDLVWLDGKLWIAMAGMHQLWRFDPSSGVVEPAAGTGHESIHDGPLAGATFAQPSGLAALNGVLYIADSETSAVRSVDPASDRVRRLVGRGLFQFGDVDAIGDSVRLQHPLAVAATMEAGRAAVYIADSYNDKIKRLDPATRAVRTVFGGAEQDEPEPTDGDAETATFWEPGGLSLASRTLYVADTNNHAVRAVDLDAGTVRTLEVWEA